MSAEPTTTVSLTHDDIAILREGLRARLAVLDKFADKPKAVAALEPYLNRIDKVDDLLSAADARLPDASADN